MNLSTLARSARSSPWLSCGADTVTALIVFCFSLAASSVLLPVSEKNARLDVFHLASFEPPAKKIRKATLSYNRRVKTAILSLTHEEFEEVEEILNRKLPRDGEKDSYSVRLRAGELESIKLAAEEHLRYWHAASVDGGDRTVNAQYKVAGELVRKSRQALDSLS